ncbi:hypothetical protein KKD20_02290 [Patescibacteria group bacterium]|nr:hypothetical protein [Patescibacteria group bacterium]
MDEARNLGFLNGVQLVSSMWRNLSQVLPPEEMVKAVVEFYDEFEVEMISGKTLGELKTFVGHWQLRKLQDLKE